MALTAQQRDQCVVELVTNSPPIVAAKADVRAAVDAADAWCAANAASFNSALPAAFRTTSTAEQKAALLASVALRRYGK
jgi:hypothetical protein